MVRTKSLTQKFETFVFHIKVYFIEFLAAVNCLLFRLKNIVCCTLQSAVLIIVIFLCVFFFIFSNGYMAIQHMFLNIDR